MDEMVSYSVGVSKPASLCPWTCGNLSSDDLQDEICYLQSLFDVRHFDYVIKKVTNVNSALGYLQKCLPMVNIGINVIPIVKNLPMATNRSNLNAPVSWARIKFESRRISCPVLKKAHQK
jgi:hypothetical protein